MPPVIQGTALRGPAFPIEPGREGIFPRRNSGTIRQTEIIMILGTIPGERVGEPEFGSLLPTLVFDPNDLTTLSLARQYAIDAITRWAPLVRLVNVTFDQSEEVLSLFIDYVDLGDENRGDRRLVYPIRRT